MSDHAIPALELVHDPDECYICQRRLKEQALRERDEARQVAWELGRVLLGMPTGLWFVQKAAKNHSWFQKLWDEAVAKVHADNTEIHERLKQWRLETTREE